MMGIDDFGLSVLASWFANKAEKVFTPKPKAAEENNQPPERESNQSLSVSPRIKRFKTFDPWCDLDAILKTVRDPLISILIEDEPSTHYRLPSMVVESRATREWFVFYRGRMSFEGDGGGIRNSRDILAQVKSAGAAIGVWVVPKDTLDELDDGYVLWPSIRDEAIPLLAVIADEYSWHEIEQNVAKYLKP